MDKEPGQQLKHANAELKDFNFQLQLTHLQYIDVKTLQKKDKKKFKQKFGNRKGILTKKNYWIGHGTESSKVISEDYFKEATDLSENKEVPLWDPNFVTHVLKNPNKMSKLSETQMKKNKQYRHCVRPTS